jgi:hypothetical protein
VLPSRGCPLQSVSELLRRRTNGGTGCRVSSAGGADHGSRGCGGVIFPNNYGPAAQKTQSCGDDRSLAKRGSGRLGVTSI